jgi:transposase
MTDKGPKTASRKGRLYTPKSRQVRVIAASLAGNSNREISRQEGIRRDTVARILAQPEVEELRSEYRQRVLELVPDCVEGLKEKVRTKTGRPQKNADWRMLVEILKGMQIFITKEVQEQELHGSRYKEWSDDDLDRFISTGEKPIITVKATPQQALPEGEGGDSGGDGGARGAGD